MSQAVLSEEYLVTHRTKRATRGWKAVCPSCSGNDLWYTQDNGSAFCFECGAVYHVAGEHGAPDRSRAAASVSRLIFRQCVISIQPYGGSIKI
jgi:uncharacterized protein (DUF983 family)